MTRETDTERKHDSMKILIRRLHGEDYVWRTAKYHHNFFWIDDGNNIDLRRIVTVVNDNRKNYVVCEACGDTIKNTSKEIEKHRSRHKTSDACMTCAYLRKVRGKEFETKYVKQKDGLYHEKRKAEVQLKCNAGWCDSHIDSEDARKNCIFKACVAAELKPISDIFTTMPGVFDQMATVNAIPKIGYDANNSYTDNGYEFYRLNINMYDFVIYAAVNSLGIIDHIMLIDGWMDTKIHYSKKYDKLFYEYDRGYVELTSYYADELKTEIRKLYN